MILERTISFRGAFGTLWDDGQKKIICYTLEHAYPTINQGEYLVKIPDGEYTCVRGIHHLPTPPPTRGLVSVETFEVTGVPGHTGILFHVGNSNSDSDGCILLGQRARNYQLENSRLAFEQFMQGLEGINNFQLTVKLIS